MSAGRWGYWALALLWLPAGVLALAAVRFAPAAELGAWLAQALMSAQSLAPAAPSGLPLALGCRILWRLGHRRSAWAAGIGLGGVTIVAATVAGLPGPVAIAACAAVLSLPVWAVSLWLAWRRAGCAARRGGSAPGSRSGSPATAQAPGGERGP